MDSIQAQQLLDHANSALQRGDIASGIHALDQFLAAHPTHAPALELSARAYIAASDPKTAIERAERAVSIKSVAPHVLTLAEAYKANGDAQRAAKLFQKILEKVPQEPRALIGMGEIYDSSGYRQQAVNFYRALLKIEPHNLAIAIKYSNLLRQPDLPLGMAALEAAQPPRDGKVMQRMAYLSHAVFYKEWAERAKRGLMPYHVTSIDELFFKYAADDRDEYGDLADILLKKDPNGRYGISAKADVLFTTRRRHEAEPYFVKMAEVKPDSVYASIAFSSEYFRRIQSFGPGDLEKGLPPVIEAVTQNFTGDHIVYLSCNYSYFVDFARTMLLSIDDRARGTQVHLHIMDASDEEIENAKSFCARLTNTTIAISAERPDLKDRGAMVGRCYYHAIRFIRLLAHLDRYQKTLWLMDVDALLHQDPTQMFKAMGDADAAFRARPGRWEPWNQFNASVMAIAPTQRGRAYLHLVSAYIADFYQRDLLRWGIDQLAMYAAYEFLNDEQRAPSVYCLNDRHVDYESFDDSFVWCNSGRGKFLQLKMIEKGVDPNTDPERAKYVTALKVYVDRLKA
jgi:tetratricopeptide (TPR) repeat protein